MMIDLATSIPPSSHDAEHPLEPVIRKVSRIAGPIALLLMTIAGLSIVF
ncbi:hypothetical protein [Sphingobium aromaticiconvertens]